MGHAVSMSELRNKNPRNLFDLSQKQVYSTYGGSIQPCQVLEMNPGESVKFNLQQFVRARTLRTSAFARLTVHNDAFYIPYRVMWQYWDSFITQMHPTDIYNTTLLANNGGVGPNAHPYTPTGTDDSLQMPNSTPILYLGAFLRSLVAGITYNGIQVSLPEWPTRTNTNQSFTFNTVPSDILSEPLFSQRQDRTGCSLLANMLRLLDMLGYGNFNDLLFFFYNGDYSKEEPLKRVDRAVNPFRLLAYYAICENYFRNDDYTGKNVGLFNVDRLTMPNVSNGEITTAVISSAGQLLQGFSSGTSTTANSPLTQFAYMGFGLRSPLYTKDILTDIYPNQIYARTKQKVFSTIGNVPSVYASSLANNSTVVNSDGTFSSLDNNIYQSANQVSALGIVHGPFASLEHTDNILSGNAGVDSFNSTDSSSAGIFAAAQLGVYSIKNAEALQRMLEITRRATKSYAGQMRAHFGVNVDYGDRPAAPVRVRSAAFNIDINEVVATADTDSASGGSLLGQVSGKGVGAGSLRGEYHTKEHGIFMVLNYVSTPPEYKSYSSPFVRKFEAVDFFQPESDRLGMQPLYAHSTPFSVNRWGVGNTVSGGVPVPYSDIDDNQVLGWQPRYSEYKNNADVNHFGFGQGSDILSSYVIQKDTDVYSPITGLVLDYNSQYNPFARMLNNNFYVQPRTFNSIFAVSSNGDPASDNFDVNQFCELKVFRNMAVTGMPIFQL